MARVIGNEAIFERMQTYWEFTGATSGFIAGFAFVVTTDSLDFDYGDGIVISAEAREILFGIFAGCTFLIALSATLFATILYSALNLCGQENAVWFAQEFWWMINKPATMMIVSILTMLLSSFFSVGGLYPEAVNYTCWAVGFIFLVFIAYIFFSVDKRVKDHLQEMLQDMEKKRI